MASDDDARRLLGGDGIRHIAAGPGLFAAGSCSSATCAGRTSRTELVAGGEGLELAELLGQVGRARGDHQTVDALVRVRVHRARPHVDRAPSGVLQRRRVTALGLGGRKHQLELGDPFCRGKPLTREEAVASPPDPASGSAREPPMWIGSVCTCTGFGKLATWSKE